MAYYHESYSKPTLGLSSLGQRYVYRVLCADEDTNKDLVCKAPHSTRSLAQHIENGLTHPSRFISTTTDLDTAIQWADTADSKTSDLYGNTRNVIVKIDTEYLKKYHPHSYSTAFDLTQQCNLEYYLTNDKQVSFASAYQEVVFLDRVPKGAVSVETILESESESDSEETDISEDDNEYSNDEHDYYYDDYNYEDHSNDSYYY